MSQNYDVIITGAGIAGLVCGNHLARYGASVLILEQSRRCGGCLGGFSRKGFYFNSGVQSVSSSGLVFPILNDLKLYRTEDWKRASCSLMIDNNRFPVESFAGLLDNLDELYSGDISGLKPLFGKFNECAEVASLIFNENNNFIFQKGANRLFSIGILSETIIRNLQSLQGSLYTRMEDAIRNEIKDEKFYRDWKNFGHPHQSVFVSAYILHLMMHDFWYPVRGFRWLVDRLVRNFRQHDGEIKLNSRVVEILTDREGACGVRTSDGEEFFADKIIHAGDQKSLFYNMIPPHMLKKYYSKAIKDAPLSASHVQVFLGLDLEDEILKKHLPTYHTVIFSDRESSSLSDLEAPDFHKNLCMKVTAPSIFMPGTAPAKHSSLILQAFSNYNWMDCWGTGGDPDNCGARYRELKNKVMDDMIDSANRFIPGLKDKIVFKDIITPIDFYHRTLNSEGASVGWTLDPLSAEMPGKYINIVSPVKNLFLAGHYSIWPGGVPPAALTGRLLGEIITSGKRINMGVTTFRIARKILDGLTHG